MSYEELQQKNAELEKRLREVESDMEDAVGVIRGICELFGIMDKGTGQFVPEIQSGGSGMFSILGGALMSVIGDLSRAKLPKVMGGEVAREEMAKKFAFLGKIAPMMERYNARKKQLSTNE